MKEEIRKVLEDLILEEQLEIILDIVDTLLSLDYGLALDEITAVIMMADDYADMPMLVERINDILRIAMDYILGTYEVTVADEATAFQRHAVIKALIGIPLYILPDDISKIIEAEYDNEETLAHIVTMFERISVDEVLDVITHISEGSFESIKTTISDIMSIRGIAETSEVPIDRIHQINKIIAVVGADRVSLMMELANAGVRVGRDLDKLMEISFESLESHNPVDATFQIIGLVWFSNVETEQVPVTIRRLINEYTENNMELGMMMKAYSEFRMLMGDKQ